MKVLWITNIPIGDSGKIFFQKEINGLWMDSELDSFKCEDRKKYQLGVVTSAKVDSLRHEFVNGVDYFLIPYTDAYKYKAGNQKALFAIKTLLKDFKPDILHFWGSEMELALDFEKCNTDNIPGLLYVQGVCTSIARYFKAGIDEMDIIMNTTLCDIVFGNSIFGQIYRYKKKAKNEINLIKQIGNVVGESDWCNKMYSSVCPEVRYYKCPISVNRIFLDKKWKRVESTPKVIVTNAANYSIKGLHVLLKALSLVKNEYPAIKLIVPGNNKAFQSGIKNRLTKSGYTKYIEKMIVKLGLKDTVDFVGYKTPLEMAEILSNAAIFVLPSAIENHALMLKEAMTVGVPCIASIVGGVPEYAIEGQTALVYRFEEYEVLASNILKLLADKKLCNELSSKARNSMVEKHFKVSTHQRLIDIYQSVLEGTK